MLKGLHSRPSVSKSSTFVFTRVGLGEVTWSAPKWRVRTPPLSSPPNEPASPEGSDGGRPKKSKTAAQRRVRCTLLWTRIRDCEDRCNCADRKKHFLELVSCEDSFEILFQTYIVVEGGSCFAYSEDWACSPHVHPPLGHMSASASRRHGKAMATPRAHRHLRRRRGPTQLRRRLRAPAELRPRCQSCCCPPAKKVPRGRGQIGFTWEY